MHQTACRELGTCICLFKLLPEELNADPCPWCDGVGAGGGWSRGEVVLPLSWGGVKRSPGDVEAPTICFQDREASFPSDECNSLSSRFLRSHAGLCRAAPVLTSEVRLPRGTPYHSLLEPCPSLATALTQGGCLLPLALVWANRAADTEAGDGAERGGGRRPREGDGFRGGGEGRVLRQPKQARCRCLVLLGTEGLSLSPALRF